MKGECEDMILARIHLSAATKPLVIPHREQATLVELKCSADVAGVQNTDNALVT